ncbi:Ti-type conjugative transfer relaxase TraA [Pelagibacterium luteolum]|uniref:Ti-type conjugative transfer relaxase TraA n=1 Tax=Pelagibacterium luteolum TaxID=440168 RepID=A0A1G8AH15_9HYPH|nr:Ti-type conjugative transfer relaxase TraA [Pelagibacterium luteolum]SDH19620.1 Ti-type conjugative transfer relaxase TraA [Pelagibacterium luteolum]
MAIYHCSMKPVSRASGRSAVASAAYRSAERLTNERDGITHDFRTKQGVEHAEIVLPQGVDVDWARDRSTLWNAAELAEKRKDGRVAREFEIALPHELSAEQRLELTRAFAQDLADRHGTAVDFAIHQPHSASDVRNHHAHLLMTTRAVTAEGLADKATIERENKWLLANDMPTSQMQLRDIRQAWEHHANEHLARAGLDIRIDHRSHMERGLEITPTEHMGVHATQMDRRGLDVSRTRLDEDAAQRNAELIRQKPEQVLTLITNEKSVFDRHDVARTLHRYINDDAQAFQNAFSSVMASPALVELQPASEKELARYSTREMVEIESGIAASAEQLHQARTHGVDRRHVEHAIGRQDEAIRSSVATDMAGKVDRGELDAQERERRIETARLSDEQRHAIAHITGPERIAAVVGYAGAGKSTMLAAAREAWEAQGYQVHGAALSGKAAEGLEESSGIQSRTLASWEYGWQAGKGEIGRGDVFVIDEAGRHLTYVAMTRHRDGAQLYAGRDEFKDGKALSSRLSRAGVKETTLDYTSDFAERQFAERRGIAERMGVRSEIEIPRDREHTRTERQTRQPRMEAEKGGEDLAPDHGDDRRQGQRRSRFESLKLSRGAAAESRQPRAGAEIAQERPQRAEQRPRGMFDGLQLHADRRASQEPLERPEREGSLRLSASGWEASAQAKPEQERQSDRLRPLSGFERSVDRFARAWTAAERMERDGLPVLDSQKAELRDAGLELDQARPGSARLMVSAMRHDPETARVMNELSGRERVGQLVGGMDRERAMQADPNVRAERFVQRWQDFDQQRQQLRGWQHDEARGKVEGQMRGMAKGLERDPQVESILRNRSQDLGISHIRREQNIAQEMERSLTRGRSLGLER